MPQCTNNGCAIIGTAPDLPKLIFTVHGPDCDVYKFAIPTDPNCTCDAKGGLFHLITCGIFIDPDIGF